MNGAATLMAKERVVYEGPVKRKPKIRRRGAAASVFKGMDGRWHTYLNYDLPRNAEGQPLDTADASICPTCGHGYAHVMQEQRAQCNECGIEQAAERAKRLEEAGIPMGWGYAGRDENTLDRRWLYAAWVESRAQK